MGALKQSVGWNGPPRPPVVTALAVSRDSRDNGSLLCARHYELGSFTLERTNQLLKT